jgi:hypothetical protein
MASFLDLFYLSCTKKLIEFWNKEAMITEIDCGDIFIASGNANCIGEYGLRFSDITSSSVS